MITTVGAAALGGATGRNTLSVSPTAVGDIVVLATTSQGATSSTTAVGGGGVAVWRAGSSYLDTATTTYLDVWWGIVTAPGAGTVTATGLGATTFNTLFAQEFNESNPAFQWSMAAASPASGSSGASLGSGLAVSWPSLSAAPAGDSLYIGNGISVFGSLNAGATPGFIYPSTGFTSNRPAYDMAFSGTGGPTATQTNTGAFDTIAVVLAAAPPQTTTSGYSLPLLMLVA